MTSIFPIVQPTAAPQRQKLPMAKEQAWDFGQGRPIWSGGRRVYVTGAEAVLVWAWRALTVQRRRYQVYSWDYGSEVEELIGRPYTADIKESEAIRYVREALLISPYITDVEQVSVDFGGTTISISCRIITIYGEVTLNV